MIPNMFFSSTELISLVYVFIIGLIIGSFLNTVIHRIPVMMNISGTKNKFRIYNLITPPSHCDNCFSLIPFYQNIPVVSFILLSGKCPRCLTKISLIYPFIEILTGLIFVLIAFFFGLSKELFLYSFLASTLIVISVIDIKHLVLPNQITYSIILSGLIINTIYFDTPYLQILSGTIVGYLLLFAVEKVYYVTTSNHGLGRGDAKLLAGIGSWVGIFKIPQVLLIASCLGIIFFLYTSFTKDEELRFSKKIPFGPFLSLSVYLLILMN